MARRTSGTPSMYTGDLFGEVNDLQIVQASFVGETQSSFEQLIAGYTSLRVLTYSNSVSIINQAAASIDDIEIIFGREDILRGMEQYLYFQEVLLRDLITATKGRDYIREKVMQGHLRLFVVQEMISHEKLFLLDGPHGTRVISGSANFSERAFSGSQNESYICFDDDPAAWTYFSAKYERIKAQATTRISQHAVLGDDLSWEQLPAFSATQPGAEAPKLVVIAAQPPGPTIVHKVLGQKLPKAYAGLRSAIPIEKGVARIDRKTALAAVQYIKSNSRTEETNNNEWLSINHEERQAIFAGRELDLAPAAQDIASDVDVLLAYFRGFTHFRGDTERLMRDYFTFMSWFYIGPLLCDFRNDALAREDFLMDYPVVGLLYGKSNCGKSELIRVLLRSMVQHEGFLPNEWLTKSQVPQLREQNRRYPMVFDDLDRARFDNHVSAIVKDDYVSLAEYPVMVLSMNAEKDTFETEIRKRCLIIYTGASLPDHTGESRKLASQLTRLKRSLTTGLYRAYLARVLERFPHATTSDILGFSSTILVELIAEYTREPLPAWCRVVSMESYIQGKHQKVKDDLMQLRRYKPEAWSIQGDKAILKLDDIHSARKLRKDIPDYLIASGSQGDVIVFQKDDLAEFLEQQIGSAAGPDQRWWERLRRLLRG